VAVVGGQVVGNQAAVSERILREGVLILVIFQQHIAIGGGLIPEVVGFYPVHLLPHAPPVGVVGVLDDGGIREGDCGGLGWSDSTI
jgi:hypothetical protein